MRADQDPQGDHRPRLLIPITIMFAVRYVVRTGLLDQLADACVPVLALSWDDPELAAELEAGGHEVIRLPDPQLTSTAVGSFQQLDLHFARRLASPSTRIDAARRSRDWDRSKRLRRWIADQRNALQTRRPGHEASVVASLRSSLDAETNVADYDAFLAEHRIDAVFSVTPFAAQEQVLLLAVERCGLPTCTSILSFDNITTRPPLPITFDRYLVWNRFNRDEILRGYPTVAADRVALVGPAQFDFYADPSLVVDESTWRSRLGLAPDARTLLYGAGAVSVAPHETQHLDDVLEAIDAGRLPADLRVVLRRHPLDRSGRWDRFRDHAAVAFDDPGRLGEDRPGSANLDERQISDLCSSLAHADVHLSVSSTMTLDGAFFDKPQIGPAYDATPGGAFDRHARALYEREHFLPITASGGIDLVHSPAQLVASVAFHLADPAAQRPGRERMLTELCTFTDGRCTPRVAAQVRAFLATVT